MEDHPDPALQFFPDGVVDLYSVLDVPEDATEEQIKRAYKKLALRFHPDKVLSQTGINAADISTRFQQLGFAYAVLSSEGRRRRYDSTGRTDELVFGEGEADFDWNEYFRTLWTGEVSADTLREFKKKYQNSHEEREDVLASYASCSGSLATILASVPCLEVLDDEERIVALVNEAIVADDIPRLPGWSASLADAKGRDKMRSQARQEAKEAEETAREMGVWDELFGEGRSGASGSKKKVPKKGKGKGTGSAAAEDEDDDTAGLQALISKRQEQRSGNMEGLIARLEREEAERLAKKGKGKKGGKADGKLPPPPFGGPSRGGDPPPALADEDFEAFQAKLFADKMKGESKEVKGAGKRKAKKGDDEAVPSLGKKAKRN